MGTYYVVSSTLSWITLECAHHWQSSKYHGRCLLAVQDYDSDSSGSWPIYLSSSSPAVCSISLRLVRKKTKPIQMPHFFNWGEIAHCALRLAQRALMSRLVSCKGKRALFVAS